MSQRRTMLIVITDGAHARFVRTAEDNTLRTQRAFDAVTAHDRSSDLRSDHPGASVHTGSTAHHAVAPRHDPHQMEKERFARTVADQLNTATGDDAFEALVLVAPSHTLQVVLHALQAGVRARIIGTLEKDLVKTPDGELAPHLREWVPPVLRPGLSAS